jgi:hypothetical protein
MANVNPVEGANANHRPLPFRLEQFETKMNLH